MAQKGFLQPLKKIARKFLRPQPKYAYLPDHTVVKDYADFAGLSVAEVEKRINTYKKLTRKEWNQLPPGGFEDKAGKFYASSNFYICDILFANVSKKLLVENLDGFTPRIMESIRNHPGKRFLEFGGGTGVFCEIVSELGKDVTYLDIPGQQFEFAKWRFERYGLPIRMVQTQPGELKLEGEYDIIFTNAVMEHLPDPLTPTAELCRHISKGGILVMLVDLSGEEEDMPMHKDVDIEKLHKVVADSGMKNQYGQHGFCSIWVRP